MTTYREKQKQALRDHLYQTSIRLFLEKGYDYSSIDSIVKEAGVSKGTFFNYFPVKESVIALFFEQITLAGLLEAKSKQIGRSMEDILTLMHALFTQGDRQRELFSLTARLIPNSDYLRNAESTADQQPLDYMQDCLEKDIRNGILPEDTDIDLTLSMLISTLTWTAHEWIADMTAMDPYREIERRIHFIFKALR